MAFVTSIPLTATSSRLAISPRTARVALTPQRAAVARRASVAPRMEFEISDGVEFKLDIVVFALSIAGWVIPSSLPSGIPLTEGTGLTQAFIASMQTNLANFPKGPAADDPFWLLMFLWHVGLFACMIFGTIGANLKKSRETGV